MLSEKEKVSAGQLLAVMETTASIDEINRLKQIVDTIRKPEFLISKILPEFSELGELQETYGAFRRDLSDLKNYLENDFNGFKIASLTEEIRGIQEYINRLIVKEKLYSENQKLEAKKYKRDSLLFVDKIIPESELEKSHQSLIRMNIELQQVRLDHSEKSIEMAEKRQLLQDYNIKRVEDKEKLVAVLNESYMNLNARIKIWENTYLLISPVDGIVSFTRFWNANQSVVKDEPVINCSSS